jgi:hypothetical protein
MTDDLIDTAPAFVDMAHRIVWCVAATSGSSGEPRTRVLHPVWEWDGERLVGWIATSPRSHKAGDLAANPRLSLTYWAANHDTCTADCDTAWDDSSELRAAGWQRFVDAPAPVGYDPSMIPGWTSPDAPEFGVLRLHPRRLAVMEGTAMVGGGGVRVRWSAGR